MKRIQVPCDKKQLKSLRAGEDVLLSGIIYTARDQAHARLCELIQKKKKLPFVLKGQVIYYCGPTGTPRGKVIGSCGPTTSLRMDRFSVLFLKRGLTGMIGKGRRSGQMRRMMKKYGGVYFVAPAGCGALLATKVVSKQVVALEELGPEAVYRLTVKDFPLIVAIDAEGNDLYKELW